MTATSIVIPGASAEEIAAISAALEALLGGDDEITIERAPASRWRAAARLVGNPYDAARHSRLPRLGN